MCIVRRRWSIYIVSGCHKFYNCILLYLRLLDYFSLGAIILELFTECIAKLKCQLFNNKPSTQMVDQFVCTGIWTMNFMICLKYAQALWQQIQMEAI